MDYIVSKSEYLELMETLKSIGFKWADGDDLNTYSPFAIHVTHNQMKIHADEETKQVWYNFMNEVFNIKKKEPLELDTFKSFMEWAQYTEANLGNNFRDFYNSDYARGDYEQFVTAWNQGKIGPETTNIYWED